MRFPKGIRVKDIMPGSGEIAAQGRVAIVHYECFLPRGERRETSRERS